MTGLISSRVGQDIMTSQAALLAKQVAVFGLNAKMLGAQYSIKNVLGLAGAGTVDAALHTNNLRHVAAGNAMTMLDQVATATRLLANDQLAQAASLGKVGASLPRDDVRVLFAARDARIASMAGNLPDTATAARAMGISTDKALASLAAQFGAQAAMKKDALCIPAAFLHAPAIHIRREPLITPPRPDNRPLFPDESYLPEQENGRTARRTGRARRSFRYAPEFVLKAYARLAESGVYVTQEMLACELKVSLRTIQRWMTPDAMGLDWPPER